LRKPLDELKEVLDCRDARFTENTQRIETNERIARSFSARIFGYDFSRCRVESHEHDRTTKVTVIKLLDLFHQLLADGHASVPS
uniref:UCH domain-containing protein n=1 Tax=Gongylonema pulchrum TaxID=637853 RepID=A0A183DGG4_9BILA